MLQINKDNFKNEVEECQGLVVIDLYADWCGPCRMLAPILAQLEGEYPEVKFCKINVDDEPELAERFGVFSIPTLVVMKNGEVVNKSSGARPKAQILELLG